MVVRPPDLLAPSALLTEQPWAMAGHRPVRLDLPSFAQLGNPGQGPATEPLLQVAVDGRQVVHPVTQSEHALSALRHGDPAIGEAQTKAAAATMDAVLGQGITTSHGLFLPYRFDFPLHGDPSNTIHAPWFSAMAQGEALAAVAWLADRTGDERWFERCNLLVRSLTTLRSDIDEGEPWVVFVDDDHLLWFEEYAGDVIPMRVLNGHLFTLFGLYDYWLLTGDARVIPWLDGAATTVEYALPRLRRRGEPSFYGLRVQDVPVAQSIKYHRVHVRQLRLLATVFGDERFRSYADALESDAS